MLLEKFSRFFRRYDLHLHPRHKAAVFLPMIAAVREYSIVDAIKTGWEAGKSAALQSNGDTVEIVDLEVREDQGVVVILFHRSSPDAADPMYRKREKKKISLRQADKDQDEEQSVSAHFIVEIAPKTQGTFRAALEEIPGISLAVVQAIIAPILRDYSYEFSDKKGKDIDTYSVLKVEGIKSESLVEALKTQTLNYITLTRTVMLDAPDGEGIIEPMNEKMRYRVIGNPADPNWTERLEGFVKRARGQGWEDVCLDISLDDQRHRTVKIDRDQEAKEILFVRSEQVSVATELKPCTATILDEMVIKGIGVIAKIP